MKPKNLKNLILTIILYFILKYVAFYLFLAFKHNDFYFFSIHNMTEFWYWWMLLFLPVTTLTIFIAPIFIMFRTQNRILFLTLFFIILVAEYFLYTYFASQADQMNGIYNAIISSVFFIAFFSKQFRRIFSQQLKTRT